MTCVVEMVGPGGTGKTSIAAELSLLHDVLVIFVNARNAFIARARAGFAAVKLAARFGLGPAETLSLFRKCSSVENGLIHFRRSAAPVLILDEGPIRTLRDTRCSTFRERRAWWRYAQSVVCRMAKREVTLVLVNVRLDDAVRRRRYDKRGGRTVAAEAGLPSFKRGLKRLLDRLSRRQDAQSIPSLGRAVSTLIARCPVAAQHISFEVDAKETPAEIAARLHALVVARNDAEVSGRRPSQRT